MPSCAAEMPWVAVRPASICMACSQVWRLVGPSFLPPIQRGSCLEMDASILNARTCCTFSTAFVASAARAIGVLAFLAFLAFLAGGAFLAVLAAAAGFFRFLLAVATADRAR